MIKKSRKNRIIHILMAGLAFCIGMSAGTSTCQAAESSAVSESVSYLTKEWSDSNKSVTTTISNCSSPKSISSVVNEGDYPTLGDGWYVADQNITVTNRLNVVGDVHLILCDGVTLNCKDGIRMVTKTNGDNAADKKPVLSIYAQSDDLSKAGKLIANADDDKAGIGGDKMESNGEVNIYGGNITATGGEYAAGIGGGAAKYGYLYTIKGGSGGTVRIFGGKVDATGGEGGAGVGGGDSTRKDEKSVDLYMYAGTLIAHGGDDAAGIGGGGGYSVDAFDNHGATGGRGGRVSIYGGTVKAYGGDYGAGIGGGSGSRKGGEFLIDGGDVTAQGGCYAAGIGGGFGNSGAKKENPGTHHSSTDYLQSKYGGGTGGDVTINGGTVRAIGGKDGAGIGGGDGDNSHSLKTLNLFYYGDRIGGWGGNTGIFGGTVYAKGNGGGAGIGGGAYGRGGRTLLHGGTIVAEAGEDCDCAIGAGYKETKLSDTIIGENSSLIFKAGTGSGNVSTVLASERLNASKSNKRVEISSCDHKESTYIIGEKTHSISCKYCGLLVKDEEHDCSHNGVCVCGYREGGQYCTVELIINETTRESCNIKKGGDFLIPELADQGGKKCTGWVVSGNTAHIYKSGETVKIDQDTSIKAQYEQIYTISCNEVKYNGKPAGRLTASSKETVSGEKITINFDPYEDYGSENGYYISSFTVNALGKNTKYTIKESDTNMSFVMPSSDVTVTAEYSKLVNKIRLYSQSSDGIAYEDWCKADEDYTLPTLKTCQFTGPEGAVFKGWQKKGEKTITDAGTSVTLTGDTVFYAVWKYKVSIYKNDSTDKIRDEYVSPGDSYSIPAYENSEVGEPPEDMNFVGWKIGGRIYQPGTSITINSNLTLTAQWGYPVTISQPTEGGSLSLLTDQTQTEQTIYAVPGETVRVQVQTVSGENFAASSVYYTYKDANDSSKQVTKQAVHTLDNSDQIWEFTMQDSAVKVSASFVQGSKLIINPIINPYQDEGIISYIINNEETSVKSDGCSVSINSGKSVILTVKQSDAYRRGEVKIISNGENITPEPYGMDDKNHTTVTPATEQVGYRFDMQAAPVTVTVRFRYNGSTDVDQQLEHGNIQIIGDAPSTALEGEEIRLKTVPDSGWRLVPNSLCYRKEINHTASGTPVEITEMDTDGNYVFTMPAYDVVITAEFTKIPIWRIKLNRGQMEIEKGDTRKLRAEVLPENTYYQDIIWESSDENVAEVDADGTVTGKNEGTATITAKAGPTGSEVRNSCTVTVTAATVKESSVEIAPKAKKLIYTGEPQNIVRKGMASCGTIYYAVTSDEKTIPEDSSYSRDVPAETNAGSYCVWYKVFGDDGYQDTSAESLTVTIDKKNIVPTVSVNGTCTYNGKEVLPELTVKDGDTVLSDDDYEISGYNNVDAGTAELTVRSGENGNYRFEPVSQNFTINKADHPEKNVSFETVYGNSDSKDMTAYIEKGGNIDGDITIDDPYQIFTEPPVQSENRLSYSVSSDESLIGKSANISVPVGESDNYLAYVIKAIITVVDMANGPVTNTYPVTGVSLDINSKTVNAGDIFTLTATVTPDDADDNSVTWSSSDESVATVDADGNVTAIAAGTATITVTTNDGGYTATCEVTVITPESTPDTTVKENSPRTVSVKIGDYTVEYPEECSFYNGKKAAFNGDVKIYGADGSQVSYDRIRIAKATKVGKTYFKIKNPNVSDKTQRKLLKKARIPMTISAYTVSSDDSVNVVVDGKGSVKKVTVNGIKLKRKEYTGSADSLSFSGRFTGAWKSSD